MRLDEMKYSVQNLMHRKLRSFLSILSILIGITAIFSLISFGFGIQDYIDTVAEEAGKDKLFIQAKGVGAPGTDDNFFLTDSDVNFVSKIKGVNEIEGVYFQVAEVELKNQRKFFFVSAYDPKARDFIEEAFTINIFKGRQLKKGDLDKVVLGYNYLLENRIFKRALNLGDKINVNKKQFEIVGFFEELGNPSDDANVYVTDKAFENLYPDKKDKFGLVMLRAEKNVVPAILADKISDKLRKHKDQDKGNEDFFVQSFEDALATFNVIIGVINGVLILIALISVIVATVNIMNTMYTSVFERTKEIGIMKAIGARNNEILFIFVFESGLLGLIGGIMGVILGYIIASAGGRAAAAAGFALLKPVFPMSLIVGSLLFSLFVGILAGILPSIQASKLRPVDALRYE